MLANEIVLTKSWEESGDIQLDSASVQQLVEYIMGNDVHMYIPQSYHPKFKVT